MTTYAVTGATGRLGSLIVESLLARGIAPDDLVAVVRDVRNAGDLIESGVDVRVADYDDPAALRVALDGVDKLVFVSSSVVENRIQQHENVIAAAVDAGVGFIAYTSMVQADTSPLRLATDHAATEKILRDVDVSTVFLRNGWYWENYLPLAHIAAFETAKMPGVTGDGRIAGVSRTDLADAAAAAVLADDPKQIYELAAGPGATNDDIVAAISAIGDTEVEFVGLSEERYAAFLVSVGIPATFASLVADCLARTAEGSVEGNADDLQALLGRPPRSLETVLREHLARPAEA